MLYSDRLAECVLAGVPEKTVNIGAEMAFAVVYVRDVEETIFILVLLIDAAHKRRRRWQDLIDKDEDGLFWGELDALANDVDELSNCEVGGYKVLLLVDGCDVRLLDLLADDLGAEG